MNKKVIHTVLDDIALRFPDYIAIEDFNGSINYKELYERSNGIANALVNGGVQVGEVVAVYMQSSISYVAAILGIQKAGGVFMPIAPGYPDQRMLEILTKVAPAAFLVSLEDLALFDLFVMNTGCSIPKDRFFLLDGKNLKMATSDLAFANNKDQFKPLDKSPLPLKVQEDSTNYIIYTSGSTGSPKVIEGVHKSLSHFIHWQVKEFKLHEERIGQFAPISFDVSFRDIFTPLLSKGTLLIPEQGVKFDAKYLLSWIGEKRLTAIHIVPSIFRQLINEIQHNPLLRDEVKTLKFIFLAGEALYFKDVENWWKVAGANAELVNLYGPSETTLAKLFHRVLPQDESINPNAIVPLGKPISNTMVAIINDGILCEHGEVGEIHIKTPFRSKGYFKDPELTKKRFIQNPLHQNNVDILYKTGDLGKKLADGNIAFLGRADQQIKIRGNRVELLEVQNRLEAIQGIHQAVVVPYQQDNFDIKIIGYYTANEQLEPTTIRKYMEAHVPAYMIPSFLVYQEDFPLNFNGKVDKKALPKPESLLYETSAYVAPENKVQQLLADIWSEVLGIKKIGIHHTFFDLGGHSLSATSVVSLIHKKMDVEISLKEFFEFPTISELAKVLSSKGHTVLSNISKVRIKDYYAVTPQQKSMWFASQIKGYEAAYVMGGVYMLENSIDPQLLEKAFQKIIERYEILRTVFPKINGNPVQKILTMADAAITLDFEDKEIDHKSFNLLTSETFKSPFNLEEGPLFKMKLVKLSNTKYALILHLHHLICDAWSNAIITKEFMLFYNSFRNNIKLELPLPSIQYKDYSEWLDNKTGNLNKLETYWINKLATSKGSVNLPIDNEYTLLRTNEAATLEFSFGKALSKKIRSYLNKEQLSLFMWVSGLLQVLLYKYSGDKCINIGTPVAGRNHPELENQIGLFLNYLVISQQINPMLAIPSYFKEVKKTILTAYEHQEYPYYYLAEKLGTMQGQVTEGLYNVLLVMNNEGLNGNENDIKQLEQVFGLKQYQFEHKYSKLDLSLFFNDQSDISFKIEYKKELFNTNTIEIMGQKILHLAKLITLQSDLKLKDLVYEISEQTEKDQHALGTSQLSSDF